MTMMKPKLKLRPIADPKDKQMKEATATVDRQRKSGIEMPKVIAAKEKKGYL